MGLTSLKKKPSATEDICNKQILVIGVMNKLTYLLLEVDICRFPKIPGYLQIINFTKIFQEINHRFCEYDTLWL